MCTLCTDGNMQRLRQQELILKHTAIWLTHHFLPKDPSYRSLPGPHVKWCSQWWLWPTRLPLHLFPAFTWSNRIRPSLVLPATAHWGHRKVCLQWELKGDFFFFFKENGQCFGLTFQICFWDSYWLQKVADTGAPEWTRRKLHTLDGHILTCPDKAERLIMQLQKSKAKTSHSHCLLGVICILTLRNVI